MSHSLCNCLSPILTTFTLPARSCAGAFGCSVSSGAPIYGRSRLASLLPGRIRLCLCLPSPASVPISCSSFFFSFFPLLQTYLSPHDPHSVSDFFSPDSLILWAFSPPYPLQRHCADFLGRLFYSGVPSAHCSPQLASLFVGCYLGCLLFVRLTPVVRMSHVVPGAPIYRRSRLASLLLGRNRLCPFSAVSVLTGCSLFLLCDLISFYLIRIPFSTSFSPPDSLVFCRPLPLVSSPVALCRSLGVSLVRCVLRSLSPPTCLATCRSLSGVSPFCVSHLSGADVSRRFRRTDPLEAPACLVVTRPHSFVSPFFAFRYV